jgi:acetyl esterase/lipase
MNPWLRRLTPAVVFTFAMVVAVAKPKAEHERMTPVPADQPIPVGDFFRPPLFDDPELNPAGTHFAAMMTPGADQRQLVIFDLKTKKIERLGGERRDIYGYRWQNDRQVTFRVVREKRWGEGLFIAEIGKFSQVAPVQRFNVFIPIGSPKSNPMHMVAWMPASLGEDYGDGGIVKIDLGQMSPYGDVGDGLRAEIIERYPTPDGGQVMGYRADKNGELAFAFTYRDGKKKLHRLESRMWKPCPVDLEETLFASVGEERFEIFVYAAPEKGRPRGLYRMDATTGELGALVYQDSKYDMVNVRMYRHPVTERILGAQYYRKGLQSVWFDPVYRELQDALDKSFPHDVVRILGSDRAEKEYMIHVYSDTRPGMYYRLNRDTFEAVPLADSNPWIDPKRMRPMQTIAYKARDGREIEGFVTLPAGASKQSPAPLVVLPHGGPWARDVWGWDSEAQFLASRGYAVFQPNYRGSIGHTWKFPEEDEWDFAKMHQDVTDGVKAVIKTGLIDRDRVAIMGASFGGYLALTGATGEGEFYRCAISMAGVFDWQMLIKAERDNDSFIQHDYLLRKLGNPKVQKEKFDAFSPINRVQQIKIPLFVAHGINDRVATIDQSVSLIGELEKYKIPYEKMFKKGETHGFHKLENRIEYYTAIEAFLAKHLGPRTSAVAAAPGVSGL